MALKPYVIVDTSLTPDEVRDEAVAIEPGTTAYWLLLTDDQVECLADGVVPEDVARRAFGMLEWKRRAARVVRRRKVSA